MNGRPDRTCRVVRRDQRRRRCARTVIADERRRWPTRSTIRRAPHRGCQPRPGRCRSRAARRPAADEVRLGDGHQAGSTGSCSGAGRPRRCRPPGRSRPSPSTRPARGGGVGLEQLALDRRRRSAGGTRSPTAGRAGWPARPSSGDRSTPAPGHRAEQRLGVRVLRVGGDLVGRRRPRRCARGTSPRCGRPRRAPRPGRG